jgi:hypothetical protein
MKKKFLVFILIFSFLAHSSIFAEPKAVPAASASTDAATANRWQTWAFVAGTVIVATAAIILVQMHTGSSNHTSHAH